MLRVILTTSLLIVSGVSATAEGNAEKGKKVFRKCKACHQVGADAVNKTGPALTGIVGKTAASAVDFKYSKAMRALGEEGRIWDEANLTAFLAKPRDYVKGTSMSFAGLRRESDIADLIAYLGTTTEN